MQKAVAHCRDCQIEFRTHYGAAAHGAFAQHAVVYQPLRKKAADSSIASARIYRKSLDRKQVSEETRRHRLAENIGK